MATASGGGLAGVRAVKKTEEGRRLLYESRELHEICEANGVSEDLFHNRPTEIRSLDLFMLLDMTPHMSVFAHFPALTSLTIVQLADLSDMAGLACPHLTHLTVSETALSAMADLSQCPRLKFLNLSANELTAVDGLAGLAHLETLWLVDNHITTLEGVGHLTSLRTLWVAGNDISTIGDSLEQLTGLQELNIAGNRIGSFADIASLARLPKLVRLLFNDPHFGTNPVTALSNYTTYTLFYLKHLDTLDAVYVDPDKRLVAEATFVKKQMYYRMRIKTLKRSTGLLTRRAEDEKNDAIQQLSLHLNVLFRQRKDIDRELHFQGADPDATVQLRDKARAVDDLVATWQADIATLNHVYSLFRSRVLDLVALDCRRMMVELDTGGNIRLEDGSPSDVWYSSCVDLVHSKFYDTDMAPFGITGVVVRRVTRVHNRFLRWRFDSQPAKGAPEYLFFGEPADTDTDDGDFLSILQDGFALHPAGHDAADEGIPLTNSLSLCDVPLARASTSDKTRRGLGLAHTRGLAPRGRRLLIVKTNLGPSAQERRHGSGGSSATTVRASSAAPSGRSAIKHTAYAGHSSVYRIKPGDSRQRMVFAFDPLLLLPEYIVEYEYLEPGNKRSISVTPQQQLQHQAHAQQSDVERALKVFLDEALSPLLSVSQHDEECSRVLALPPTIPARPKIGQMTPEAVLRVGQATSLSTVQYLNLHGNTIRTVGPPLADLTALRTLILSFNEIERIDGIVDLPCLEVLDLSFNLIKRIDGLRGLPRLRRLHLNSNLVHRIDDLNVFRKYVPDLVQLWIANNAICEIKGYDSVILRRLAKLETLDGVRVTDEQRAVASENSSVISPQIIRQNATAKLRPVFVLARSATTPRGPSADDDGASTVPGDLTSRSTHSAPPTARGGSAAGQWWLDIVDLCLDQRGIRKIQSMERLSALRRLSLVDNEIAKIEGLDGCPNLEELNLENNRIKAIEGLDTLRRLAKLEIGFNRLTSLDGVHKLTSLTLLSAEGNQIESLAGLRGLPNIMELYLGDNRIASREVFPLKALPKLMILDLSGNPVVDRPTYRLFVIYYLARLKVLDGTSIEPQEQSQAKDQYAGRLTADFLLERLGQHSFSHIKQLELSSCNIREMDPIVKSTFASLTHLNLEHNSLSSLGLDLPSLQVLCLSHNRLEANGTPDRGDVWGMSTLTSLEVLDLSFNAIRSISALHIGSLTQLRSLNVATNELTKLDGVAGLVELTSLVVDHNKIKFLDDPAPFRGLVSLSQLSAADNAIKAIHAIGAASALTSLSLASNRVSELRDLEHLDLPRLETIAMHGNPVARKTHYRHALIRRLPLVRSIDGKGVGREERDKAESTPLPEPSSHAVHLEAKPPPPNKVPIRLQDLSFDPFQGLSAKRGPSRGGKR